MHRHDLFQFDVVLPSQHFRRRRKQTPELRLMMAVLHDALDCIETYRLATDTDGRRQFWQAQRWFLADEAHWPYSFECICAALDLDSQAVRQRLRVAGECESDRLRAAASPRLSLWTVERKNNVEGIVAEAEAGDVCHEDRKRRA